MQKCSSTYYLKKIPSPSCITYEDLVNYQPPFGIVSGTNTVEECETQNCLSCRDNKDFCECVGASTTFFKITDQGQFECIENALTPSLKGYGPEKDNHQDKKLKKCSIHGCKLCYLDYKKCWECDNEAGFLYQDPTQLPNVLRNLIFRMGGEFTKGSRGRISLSSAKITPAA